MSTIEETLKQLLELTSKKFHISVDQLNPEDDFFEKLDINSLQVLELLTQLETHLQIELPDYKLQGIKDFGTLAERSHSRLS